MDDPWIILCALAIDALVGYPAVLQRHVPHPVVWIGKAITALEMRWNRPDAGYRKASGLVCVFLVAGAAGLSGLALEMAGPVAVAVAGSLGLAQRSLYDHVAAVAKALEGHDLPAARDAVAKIVGRDVQALDDAGVATAALESLAESFNDGVAAPLFWFLLGGLPGLFIYKAVNTADSMIGHMEPRWRAFGWAAARIAAAMNGLPARRAGVLGGVAGWGGWRVMWRDARKHASPNAGWTEAAMAGALHLRLGGPATYDGVVHDRPRFGDGLPATVVDLRRGLRLYVVACGILWALVALGGFAWRQ